MKNLIIGLILGGVATFFGLSLMNRDTTETASLSDKSMQVSAERMSVADADTDKSSVEKDMQPVRIVDARKKVITSLVDEAELENMSTDELKDLVRNFQTQLTSLQDTVSTQKEAIEKLNDERERRRNPMEEENLTPEQATAALANIREALETADPEYKEVLESALNLYEGEELVTPSNDALLRHYAEEPKVQWATSAQAWLQSYFQSGIEPDITLIQLNCRSSYCELYGFYGSETTIADYRLPAAKISNFFRKMSDAPNYSGLFRNAENISLNTSSDNSYMSFHVFIRSVN